MLQLQIPKIMPHCKILATLHPDGGIIRTIMKSQTSRRSINHSIYAKEPMRFCDKVIWYKKHWKIVHSLQLRNYLRCFNSCASPAWKDFVVTGKNARGLSDFKGNTCVSDREVLPGTEKIASPQGKAHMRVSWKWQRCEGDVAVFYLKSTSKTKPWKS